jgi:hypothetical protein
MGCSLYLSHSAQSLPITAIFGRDMLFDVPFIVIWNKLGSIGNAKWIATLPTKTKHGLNGTTKLVIK